MATFSDTLPRANATSRDALTPSHRLPPPPSAPSPLERALAVLDGPATLIVWRLFWGARPFCDLLRHVPGVSRKALRSHLVQMERRGLVTRRLRAEAPRRAEYGLTPLGETLKPIVGGMYEWGLVFGPRPQPGAERPGGAPTAEAHTLARARHAFAAEPSRAHDNV